MKKILLITSLSLLAFFTQKVNAQLLYLDTAAAGFFFNNGANSTMLDDVQIDSTLQFDTLHITQLKFGVYRGGNAPAVTVSFFYCPINDTATSSATAPAIPPVLLSTLSLPANGTSAVDQTLTIGDSLHTLFNIPRQLNIPYSGFQTFFVGMSFSVQTGGANDNGWLFAVQSPGYPNADSVWIYDPVNGLQSGNFGGTPVASFNVQIFGTLGTLPVSFINFDGMLKNNSAVLNWSTASELNNKGFEVERSSDGVNFSYIGFVAGQGNSSRVNNYTYTDNKILSGSNYYRLKQIDLDGKYNYSSIIRLDFSNFGWQIMGNPSTNNTWAQLQLDKQANVSLQIISSSGQVMQTINKGTIQKGTYSIPLNLNNAASGIYFVKLQVDNQTYSKQIIK